MRPRFCLTTSKDPASINSHEESISAKLDLAALNVSNTLEKLSNPRNETLIALGRGGQASAILVTNPSVPNFAKWSVIKKTQ